MNLDILCLSHLRWNFVYQRPQHLLSRFAINCRVFVWEEPIYDASFSYLDIKKQPDANIWIMVPHLIPGGSDIENIFSQKSLINEMMASMHINKYLLWYYSPMAMDFTDHLSAEVTVYDCMDELSNFKFASSRLKENEARLFKIADIVFTGGRHLYAAKKHLHNNIHPFPSSIDKAHFLLARKSLPEPADQLNIPHPRIGFYGVVDERFNLQMVQDIASAMPQWHLVILGPVVKIDPATLPSNNNIHYLGGKDYKDLPQYLAGWDIAMMPFAINESTTYISPTKTPEYLAGGKQVISTPIKDVVTPYGDLNLVHIVATLEEFIDAAINILATVNNEAWLKKTDEFLADISWDKTFENMNALILKVKDKNISISGTNKNEVLNY